MPAVSIDTFFACTLMVIVVLSAMAGASKIVSPYINNSAQENAGQRFRRISDFLLLNTGVPRGWGQDAQTEPESFGLARFGSESLWELDIDKVSRLNSENQYALDYAAAFASLGMPDVSFRIGIKPVFDVEVNLTSTFSSLNETTYQFRIRTEKNGNPMQTLLKCYVIAEDYSNATNAFASNGEFDQNITISNNTGGPALLVVLAEHAYDYRISSFNVCPFMHNSAEPKPRGTFLKLSPLNHILNASLVYPEENLSKAYAVTFSYNSTLTQNSSNNKSATYEIPRFLDSTPTIIVVTGRNSSDFYAEYVSYPQVPFQFGADLESLASLSNVFVYTQNVLIDSAIYESTIWLWGPKR